MVAPIWSRYLRMKLSITDSALGIDIFISKIETLYNQAPYVYRASDMATTGTLIWLVDSVQLLLAQVNMIPNSICRVFTREALKTSFSSSLKPANTLTTMGSEITCSQSINSWRSRTWILRHAGRVIMPNSAIRYSVSIVTHTASTSRSRGSFALESCV